MGSKQESTTETTIRGIGGQEQQARNMLMQLAESAQGQMGNLGALASGQMQITPQDEALIRRIGELSGEINRSQMQDNFAFMSGQLEDNLLARGMGGASIEAVDKAMLGRQLQQSLDQSAMQQQVTSAQQLRQHALDRAGLQLNANQLLLNQLLGGAGAVSQMGLQERLAQTTTTNTQETSAMGNVMGMVGQLGGAALGGLTSGIGAGMVGGAGEYVSAGAGPPSQAALRQRNQPFYGNASVYGG